MIMKDTRVSRYPSETQTLENVGDIFEWTLAKGQKGNGRQNTIQQIIDFLTLMH
jgi:hypothetical protein